MSATSVWAGLKRAVKRAGFDTKTMWVHSLRKAFKAELTKANIQEELSECLMGHRLKGSRESYMNRNDCLEELRKAYEQADFSRDGKTKETQHEAEIQRLKIELADEKQKTEGVGQYLNALQKQIEQLKKQMAELRQGSAMK